MRALGQSIGRALQTPRDQALVLAIEGELGAGKTTLIAGILAALGVAGPVRSPTYTLIEPYEAAGLQVYHLDLYRLKDTQEVEALGIRDLLLPKAVLLIEWPSRGAGSLPAADLEVRIEYPVSAQPGRSVAFQAATAAGREIIQQVVAE